MFPGKLSEIAVGQLEHVRWQGLHFYDVILPLFMFTSAGSVLPDCRYWRLSEMAIGFVVIGVNALAVIWLLLTGCTARNRL